MAHVSQIITGPCNAIKLRNFASNQHNRSALNIVCVSRPLFIFIAIYNLRQYDNGIKSISARL